MSEEKPVERIALETLESMVAECAPHLSFDLVASIYYAELDHQYDQDRQAAVQRIREIVEGHLRKVSA